MSRASNQDIPPELEYLWLRTANTKGTQYEDTLSINPAKAVYSAQPGHVQTVQADTASRFAKWLTDRHAKKLSPAARSEFFTARRRELQQYTANTQYWMESYLTWDLIALQTPTVMDYEQDLPLKYVDPLRQPTRCVYTGNQATYEPFEANHGTSKPPPGWAGAVIDNKFRDLWLAQRRVLFHMPMGIKKSEEWPVLLLGSVVITADATVRGNRVWWTVQPKAHFAQTYTNLGPGLQELDARWHKDFSSRQAIPGDQPMGWSLSREVKFRMDARFQAVWIGSNYNEWLAVRIFIAPSLGVYFSRNDAVSCNHESSISCWVAAP